MYRITTYSNGNKDVLDETEDEDVLREEIEACTNDLEKGAINSFTVSRISKNNYQKPWWEDKK